MQAPARLTRRAATCATALLACLLALAVTPVPTAAGAHPHAHRQVTRAAAVLPTVMADPAHAAHRADHAAVVPAGPTAAGSDLARAGTAEAPLTANHRTARTPPARGPPAQAPA